MCLDKVNLFAARERKLLQDKLDRFSHRQTVMNEQLITLNDNLTDTTALQAVYEAKREELELDYQNQKRSITRANRELRRAFRKSKNGVREYKRRNKYKYI